MQRHWFMHHWSIDVAPLLQIDRLALWFWLIALLHHWSIGLISSDFWFVDALRLVSLAWWSIDPLIPIHWLIDAWLHGFWFIDPSIHCVLFHWPPASLRRCLIESDAMAHCLNGPLRWYIDWLSLLPSIQFTPLVLHCSTDAHWHVIVSLSYRFWFIGVLMRGNHLLIHWSISSLMQRRSVLSHWLTALGSLTHWASTNLFIESCVGTPIFLWLTAAVFL